MIDRISSVSFDAKGVQTSHSDQFAEFLKTLTVPSAPAVSDSDAVEPYRSEDVLSAGYWYEDIEYPTYDYTFSRVIVLISAAVEKPNMDTLSTPSLYQNAFALKGVAESDFLQEAITIGLANLDDSARIAELEIAWVEVDEVNNQKDETYSLVCTDWESG